MLLSRRIRFIFCRETHSTNSTLSRAFGLKDFSILFYIKVSRISLSKCRFCIRMKEPKIMQFLYKLSLEIRYQFDIKLKSIQKDLKVLYLCYIISSLLAYSKVRQIKRHLAVKRQCTQFAAYSSTLLSHTPVFARTKCSQIA